MKKDGDVLLDAVIALDEKGWTTGRLQNYDGSMCAVGAINEVIFGKARVSQTFIWQARKVAQRKRITAALAEEIKNRVPMPRHDTLDYLYYEMMHDASDQRTVISFNDTKTDFEGLKALFTETAAMIGVSPERMRK